MKKKTIFTLLAILLIVLAGYLMLSSMDKKGALNTEDKCERDYILIQKFEKTDDKIYITVKNNNVCTWKIKAYNEVRIDFEDEESVNIPLGEEYDLKEDEVHTFKITLESDKLIKQIVFVE